MHITPCTSFDVPPLSRPCPSWIPPTDPQPDLLGMLVGFEALLGGWFGFLTEAPPPPPPFQTENGLDFTRVTATPTATTATLRDGAYEVTTPRYAGDPSPMTIRFVGDRIELPGNRFIPFGSVNVVVQLPSGEEVGVGRSSLSSREQTTHLLGRPGEAIPRGEIPGSTAVYRLDAAGNLSVV